MVVKNAKGREILLAMVGAVHENKQYLGDIDGLIGDGDHGMNMNKGFVTYGERLGDNETTFTDGLTELGMVLLDVYKRQQYIMGHSNISITLNLYAHASAESVKAELRSMIA